MEILKRLYHPKYLLPEARRAGPLPSSREAYSEVIRMAWPALVETLLLTLTSVVSTMMVGTRGTASIAAVGVSSPARTLITSSFAALNVATAAIIARRIGEKNRDGASSVLMQSLLICAALIGVFVTLGFVFSEPLIKLCGAHESIVGDAALFFRVWLSGIPFWAFSTIVNAANRGAGNQKIVMFSNVTANVANAVFSYLLIGGNLGFPALGIAGAGLSNAICYFIQFSISFTSVIGRSNVLHIDFKARPKLSRAISRTIFGIYSATYAEQICACIGTLVLTRIINSLGQADAFASWQIVLTLYSILVAVASGFSAATSALVGQNLGRKRPDLSYLNVKICSLLAVGSSVVIVIAFGFFGRSIAELYVPDRVAGAATIENVTRMLRLLACGSFVSILLVIIVGALRGAGDNRYVAIVVTLSMSIVRPVAAYFLCNIPQIGVVGAWYAVMIDEFIRIILIYIRFKKGKWQSIRL